MQKFKNEYEYLVHLIKCALQDLQPIEKPRELSFDKVLKYEKEHEVANNALIFASKENIYRAYPFCQKHNYPIVLCWLH